MSICIHHQHFEALIHSAVAMGANLVAGSPTGEKQLEAVYTSYNPESQTFKLSIHAVNGETLNCTTIPIEITESLWGQDSAGWEDSNHDPLS